MKTTWTVNWLFRRWRPAGINLSVVVESGRPIRVFLGDEFHHVVLRLAPTWQPWRYRARLDASVRFLLWQDARLRVRLDAAHDEFCRGLDAREEGSRS